MITIGIAVANQSEAMEADTISKNGRSLKSHTSKANTMKKIIVILLLLASRFSLYAQTPEWLIGRWYSDGVFIFEVQQTKKMDGRNSQVLIWKEDNGNFADFEGLSGNIAYFKFFNTGDRVSITRLSSNKISYSNPRSGAEYILFSSKEASLPSSVSSGVPKNSEIPSTASSETPKNSEIPSWALGHWKMGGGGTINISTDNGYVDDIFGSAILVSINGNVASFKYSTTGINFTITQGSNINTLYIALEGRSPITLYR